MNPANMMFSPALKYTPAYSLRDVPAPSKNYHLCGTSLSYAVVATSTDRVIGLFPSLYWAQRFTHGHLDVDVKIMEVTG